MCHFPKVKRLPSWQGLPWGFWWKCPSPTVPNTVWGLRPQLAPIARALGPCVPERSPAPEGMRGVAYSATTTPHGQTHAFPPVSGPWAPFRFLRIRMDLLAPRKHTHTACTQFQAHGCPPNTPVASSRCSWTPTATPREREPSPTWPSAEWLNFPGGGQANHHKDPLPQESTPTLRM